MRYLTCALSCFTQTGSSANTTPAAPATVTPEMAIQQIMEAVDSLDEERIMDILMQFKFYMHAMPDQARYLLLQNPQLSYLLLQAAVRIGLLDKAQADVCAPA